MSNRIIIAGDVHGDWRRFNVFLNKKKPEMVLQAGDFGYWPREEGYELNRLKNFDTKIHWCDGNHEDHWSLKQLTTNEVSPHVFYQPRGSILTLPDGRNVLFFGGATSIDKDVRTLGRDWFPEEVPSYADFETLDKINVEIDIVISHTCPKEFEIEIHPWLIHSLARERINDSTRSLLSCIRERFRPSLWYFGHWHVAMAGHYEGCRWRALGMCPETNWWSILEDV